MLLTNIGEQKNNFSGGFKLELVTTFHIRFWCDSCESIAKNVVDIILFIEKYNCGNEYRKNKWWKKKWMKK